MKRLVLIISLAGLFLVTGSMGYAADIEAVLDDAAGVSAFSVKDSGSVERAHIDSNGNMVIKGGLRLDASGVENTTAENLIVDGSVGIGTTAPAALLSIGSGNFFQVSSTGEVRTIAGSASAPSYSFTADTDTGMYNSAANTLTFTVGGTDKVFVDTTGLGVGGVASYRFDAIGTAADLRGRIYTSAVHGSARWLFQNDAQQWGLSVDGSKNDAFIISDFSGAAGDIFSVTKAGNVGIGTTPNASALLDVSSTTKGFLPPRMTTTQRGAITTPPAGLMIYNTTTNKLNFYNGTAWEVVTSA